MDNLHIAISSTLTKLGLQTPPKTTTTAVTRQPLKRRQDKLHASIKATRAAAKLDPSKTSEIHAALHLQRQLNQTSSEIQQARLIRKHHLWATTNPKRLADSIWGRSMSSDSPDCSKEECETFFRDIFKEAAPPTTNPTWLPEQRGPLPLKPLVITTAMVTKALRKKGSKRSSPGLDGVTYQLLNKLTWLHHALATIFNKIIAQRTCPEFWRYGVTILLHKGGQKTLPNYRPITLTPTISKLFHSIVATWLENAATSSGIIPTNIQKGFLMGISGAIEHNLVLDEALVDAKSHRKNFHMLLVDLKNAFGSVPHSRIIWALRRFGAPTWVQDYVSNFYGSVHTQLQCKSWSTGYIQLHRGVLQGDTLSPLLFLLVMQISLKALHDTCPGYGYKTTSANQVHFIKCFADDLTVITSKAPQLQRAITKLEEITEWLGLEIKPSKCRTFALGKAGYRKINITIYNQTILNVEDAPSKFLGMQLSLSQSFKEKATIATKALTDIIKPLDDFPLPPRDKVELYKNFALPKMRWVLMVQDVLPTALRTITSKMEAYLKTWWGLPRATSRDALRLATGIQSISDIAEQSQCTKYCIAQSSSDPHVTSVLSHRKIRRHKPVLRLLNALGGSIPQNRLEATAKLKEGQHGQLKGTVTALVVQGAWARLDATMETDKHWRSMMWSLPHHVQQFATKAAIDVLPTRANLLRWKVGCNAACDHCGSKQTLHHVLNHCTRLLDSGAYTWRHNSILQHLLPHIQSKYPFAQIQVDLPGITYQLPFHCDTNWRPDIVILHRDHSIHFVELTVPFEPNFQTAHSRKTNKYQPLLQQAKNEGLIPHLHCVEMGSRGLPNTSWSNWVSSLPRSHSITKQCSTIALHTSYVVWSHRDVVWPNPPLYTLDRRAATDG